MLGSHANRGGGGTLLWCGIAEVTWRALLQVFFDTEVPGEYVPLKQLLQIIETVQSHDDRADHVGPDAPMPYNQMVEALLRVACVSVVEDYLDPMQKMAHFMEGQLLPALWTKFQMSMGGVVATGASLSATARLRKSKPKVDPTLFMPWVDQSPTLELQWANTLLYGMSTVEVPNGSLLLLPLPPKDNPEDALQLIVCHVPVRTDAARERPHKGREEYMAGELCVGRFALKERAASLARNHRTAFQNGRDDSLSWRITP